MVSRNILESETVKKAIEEEQEKQIKVKVQEAQRTLSELEQEYERSKEVFTKVNGARRFLRTHTS